MKATTLPAFREGLAKKLTQPVGSVMAVKSKGLAEFYGPGEGLTLEETIRGNEILMLLRSELFFVTEEMGQVVQDEATTMPLDGIQAEDAPAPVGLLWFEGGFDLPAAENPVEYGLPQFLTWRILDGVVHFTTWVQYDPRLADINPEFWQTLQATAVDGVCPRASSAGVLPFGVDLEDIRIARLLACAWAMMKQEVAHVGPPRVLPIDLKRARKRHQPDPSAVRVVSLRRVHAETNKAIQEGRYHHQWIVRGHWRRQWFATRQSHVPMYVAPYVKGPKGAPLLTGQKVYKLQH